ncbi:prenyltransferase/squalene oxidase repeat-containing protein [Actinomadura viridis]|uniref:Squalene cyclase C-terminal domain-containing protein n=1 Tax=Actinomadura viridis TaxID=58110 RepID=A0A931DEX4_9ACTN|nr:prenyltransferase/squalene oxidase repeat-containing protein [Actinomadura viridis]MBG6086296.1 hypothetical protein [Actinomadura viridis]
MGSVDVATAAGRIVDDLTAHPWGRASPSVYETGRLVSLAPWLAGQDERLRFLLESRRPDGGWGLPHDGYALVPTLSATEALLGVLRARVPCSEAAATAVPRAELVEAAGQGLRLLHGRLGADRHLDLPDMPAIEHITPYLIKRINGHLGELRVRPVPGLEAWAERDGLPVPRGMTGAMLPLFRNLLDRGEPVPEKLLHALEIAGDGARGARAVRPGPSGTIGASPAATAAWLGDGTGTGTGERAAARRYLEEAAAQHGGPVSVAAPITEFERGWVLSWLARVGVPLKVPPRVIADLRAALGTTGTGGGAGLPPDADSSAGALYALSLLGRPYPPDLLWQYETETHFCTWRGENGRSITTNAHVLEAFGQYLEATGGGADRARYAASMAKVTFWLCGRQDADGAWRDRWHASPYYATACAALALDRFGTGAGAERAVRDAVRWVLGSQRPEGSWGRWDGTAEETAYALQILLLSRHVPDGGRWAVARGAAWLRSTIETGLTSLNIPDSNKIPLWHDKDVYHPTTIVQAAIVATLHLLQSDPHVPNM